MPSLSLLKKENIWESQYFKTFGTNKIVTASFRLMKLQKKWKKTTDLLVDRLGVNDIHDINMARDESWECTGGSGDHTRPLALLFCVKAVPVAVTASVPELGTGVGLLVVVPADVIVPTRALVQNQAAARVQRYGLCRKRCHMMGKIRSDPGKRFTTSLPLMKCPPNPTSKKPFLCSLLRQHLFVHRNVLLGRSRFYNIIHIASKIIGLPAPHLHDLITEPVNHKALITTLEPGRRTPHYASHQELLFYMSKKSSIPSKTCTLNTLDWTGLDWTIYLSI